MTESIPVDLVVGWVQDLKSNFRTAASEGRVRSDHHINFALSQVERMVKTWREHQENVERLTESGKQFLVVYDDVLSEGRLKKLKWYEGNQFIMLVWSHGASQEVGDLLLELQNTNDLSVVWLTHGGDSTYDDMARLARMGGLEAIRKEFSLQDSEDLGSQEVHPQTGECSTSAVSGTAINDSEVGIFYLIAGRIVSAKIQVSEIEPLGGVHSLPVEHWALWSELQDNNPDLRGMDWSDLPRGRVVYNGKKDRFEIFADRHILADQTLIADIVADYHLENREVHRDGDEIYRCVDCVRT